MISVDMVRTWNYPKRRYRRSFAATKRRRYAYRKRKYARKMVVSRSLDNHYYKRWGNSLAYTWSNAQGTSIQNVFLFTLGQVVNPSDFTTLYDLYRILKVVVKFRLINNPDATSLPFTAATTNAANCYPRLWYCPDYDDSNSETWTQLRERAKTKCKILKPNAHVTIPVRPAVLSQVYRSAVTTAYAPKWKQWLDVAASDTPHYSLKWAIECDGFTPVLDYPYSFQVDFIYYLQFKNTR